MKHKTYVIKAWFIFHSFSKMLFIQKITLIPENWITADVGELGSNTHGREMTNYCIIDMNKTKNFNFPSSWDSTIRLNREVAGEELQVQPFCINVCKFLWTELFKHCVSSKAKAIPPSLVQYCCSTLTRLNVACVFDFAWTKMWLNRDFTYLATPLRSLV